MNYNFSHVKSHLIDQLSKTANSANSTNSANRGFYIPYSLFIIVS